MDDQQVSPVAAALRAATVIAVLRAPSEEVAVHAVDALVLGGITAVEVTYSTPDVPSVLAEVTARHPDLLVGVGTVTEPGQVRESVAAGARFVVSPGVVPEVATAMRDEGTTSIIGALTPTEVLAARRAGAELVKLFPAGLGGPALLRVLREPFDWLRVIPTGGVSAANVGEWLRAGAFAVGASGPCSRALLAEEDYEGVRRAAAEFVAAAGREVA
ncbi:MAG TPA: bifunctional 4-hydroxy-2-oxoglutarate aldolase/2-dehydro-3-deoxy-phosphogluconate aldolase [Pseudonocardiaceae bacterium]|jgi:2-dehydro-3-deoxyphosphogluconate aldolase/(4S)-4-hydroxy-2-oxoglutarate aldolase|nr:bifunctional 4-hydroxy-2-oxoglutarate aldolase/2-dehydro-3-deoxy-phosphogluconate aldolase [Pseudonocardiaceae bacterium]